ncbi:TatD family hydrolase [Phocaeicola sp.]|uniref:TatD family hydrolase n=1 Tax=Phocaeicola sp. TaxID=2773926 RepID=UPI003A90C937
MITTPFFNVHTHHLPDTNTTAILNCSMDDRAIPAYLQAQLISASLHPWYLTKENFQLQIEWLTEIIQSDSRVVALGEAGLDKICNTPFTLQLQAFRKVIELSEQCQLPLLIHSVKATEELIALHKEYHPAQAWIIHGFRGKKELAAELIRHGFFLSFGKKYQEKALSIVPTERLLLESDEEETDFPAFYEQVASLRGTTSDHIATHIRENANRLFFNR